MQLGGGEKQALGIVNIDDPFSNQFIDAIDNKLISSGKVKVLTYGIQNKDADLVAYPKEMTGSHSNYDVIYRGNYLCEIDLPIPGLFNVYNSLAAFGASFSMGIDVEHIREGLKNARQVDGRFEKVPCSQRFDIFVDYAHTPDALLKILDEIRKICQRNLIVVFGCGGNRDRSKRPIMGKVASELADLVIITADNPRSEEPKEINKGILSGVDKTMHSKFIIEGDRKKAIYLALEMATPGDCVLIAGKGHENYQIIGDTFHSFSDREMIINRLNNREPLPFPREPKVEISG
jgi:UDP-N-acetylmuramyl-tripeptide synthetase